MDAHRVGSDTFLHSCQAQNLAAVCLKRSLYKEAGIKLGAFILEGWCRIQAIEWADAALSMDGKAPKARNLMAEMPRCTFALGDKAEAEM